MNLDSFSEHDRPKKMWQHAAADSKVSEHSHVGEVPVFNCIVYVSSADEGGVRALVANLSGLECTAANEREALAKIVPAFKERIAQSLQNDSPIPWVDPPYPAESNQQTRFIPVHL